ncbi:MAG TPA: class I SAM-dependent methyltransferase [Anaerolineae bacterium]|nr:class I SAM-dependent methyltransferase [Anaerolineae bacterium]
MGDSDERALRLELDLIYRQVRKVGFHLLQLDIRRARWMAVAVLSRMSDDIRLALHNSRKVTCEYCGWEGNSFYVMNVPSGNRYNVQCRRCGSMDRYRLLLMYLRQTTGFFSQRARVLDISPAPPFQKMCLAQENLNYVSIDLSSSLAMIRADITRLCFADDSFDVVICYHVLEHVRDDVRAIREVHRVLSPNGLAILQVPISERLEETVEYGKPREAECGHVRTYGRDYPLRLRSAGFEVHEDDFAFQLNRETIERYGVTPERIFVVRK